MNYDAVPPKWPSVLDYLTRPVSAEIRPAPMSSFAFYIGGGCPPPRKTVEQDDSDPPKMLRAFATSTSTSTMATQTYFDCASYAVLTGQPYTIDVPVWGAESGTIIERMNHDYKVRYKTISTSLI